ncbi:MAG: efflux RND transporter periplasmic adaptor subunit [Deltaproteobacteria bacterium]|nr:efflux RND transporter periplasmic adaptor subunit [Deltaproteobacteria bacterium]
MNLMRTVWSLALSASLCITAAAGCKKSDSHDHAPAAAHQSEGLPASAVTVWTEKSELFMEYEPPVVGREGKFAAHLTALPGFKAVTEGEMVLTLRMADGTTLTSRANAPASPGIFRALIRPTKPGKCALSLAVSGAQVRDEIDAGACEVFPDEKAALAASGEEEEAGGIAFTKEQQWKTEFATLAVGERELQSSVQANAEVVPVAGKEAKLTAPATGRVALASPAPIVGMPVQAGQVLAVVSARLTGGADRATLDAEVQAARAELEAARSQHERAERLFKEQAVPERQVEEAKARVAVASARLGAAQGRLEQYSSGASGSAGSRQNAFQVRAPFAGTLVVASATTGESVEEGKLLFTVIDMERVWLQARVFEPDIPRVEGAKSAWFTVEGYEEPFEVNQSTGRLVTVGRVIDPQSRTVPVIFELANPGGRLRIGQYAKVYVATGAALRALAIPESAILDEGGKPVAYVQVEGERFERRALALGPRSLGWVGVREGLRAGERVVTRGAYEVKLTAASGAIPQHGHVH